MHVERRFRSDLPSARLKSISTRFTTCCSFPGRTAFEKLTELDYKGTTYYTVKNLTLYECQGWCREEPECQAASFRYVTMRTFAFRRYVFSDVGPSPQRESETDSVFRLFQFRFEPVDAHTRNRVPATERDDRQQPGGGATALRQLVLHGENANTIW